ncbi:hypothetical protein THOM_2767, partial [Trachipleistophora hominis]
VSIVFKKKSILYSMPLVNMRDDFCKYEHRLDCTSNVEKNKLSKIQIYILPHGNRGDF